MGKIVAIGGGNIWKPGVLAKTTHIDKEIIKLSKKRKPKVLFIPTASKDSESYVINFKKHFSSLGGVVDTLLLVREKPSKKEIKKKISSADIIYVGGGNTLQMMNKWNVLGVGKELHKAHKKGTVLSGLSAGAICWFSYGNSNSRKYTSGTNKLIKVSGLGLVDILYCPHYDTEKRRKADLKRMMKKTSRVVAIACEECTALEIVDEQFRIIKSKSSAKAYRIFWKNNKYVREELKNKTFLPITLLLQK